MTALEKLDTRWKKAGGRICVGLDPDLNRFPRLFKDNSPYLAIKAFNRHVVDATADLALAYKADFGSYIQYGVEGMRAFQETFEYLHERYPSIPTIADFKIGGGAAHTNGGYARFAFDLCGADCMTAQAYPGLDAMAELLARKDKLIFFLCKTSNKDAGDFQDQQVPSAGGGWPLYAEVAFHVDLWNKKKNCGIVFGATYPEDLEEVRGLVKNMPILIPGVGEQGGDLAGVVRSGATKQGRIIVSESRSIIYTHYDERPSRDNVAAFVEPIHEKLVDRTELFNDILSGRP